MHIERENFTDNFDIWAFPTPEQCLRNIVFHLGYDEKKVRMVEKEGKL